MTMGEKEEQVLTLKDLLSNYIALARRGSRYWKRALIVFTVILGAGMVWVITKQRVYKSEAKFQVLEADVPNHQERGMEEQRLSVEARLSQVYGSRSNVLDIIRRVQLYQEFAGRASETKLADLFWGRLSRKVENDTVEIAFIDPDPVKAQRVTQALIDLFQNARRRVATERARETLSAVEAQLLQLEGQLAEREEALERFTIANQAMVDQVRARRGTTINLAPQNRAPEVDTRTSARTRRLQARVAQLRSNIESLRNPSSGSSDRPEPPALQQMRERVRAKEAEVQALVSRGLTPDYPTRAAAERELQSLRGQLQVLVSQHRASQRDADNLSTAERDSRIDSLTRDLAAAQNELNESQRVDAAQANVAPGQNPAPAAVNPLTRNNIAEVEREYDRLTADLTTTRAAHSELLRRKLEKQSELRRAELSGAEQIRIIDHPSRPMEPEPPGRTKMSLIVAVIAALLASGTALISGFIDTRIYDATDLARWGQLPELPFIPDLHFDMPEGAARVEGAPPAAPAG